MINEKRTIDFILADYTAHVRDVAIQQLLKNGFSGIDPRPLNDGPTTLKELRAMYGVVETHKFPVNTIGSDKTVFTDPTVNLLFRAWHDLGHILLNAGFTPEGEREVAAWQMSYVNGIDKAIMYADIVDQDDYFHANGKYVDDQRAFVIDKVFGKQGRLPPHSPRYAVVKQREAVAA